VWNENTGCTFVTKYRIVWNEITGCTSVTKYRIVWNEITGCTSVTKYRIVWNEITGCTSVTKFTKYEVIIKTVNYMQFNMYVLLYITAVTINITVCCSKTPCSLE
jgi:hypothetical protein